MSSAVALFAKEECGGDLRRFVDQFTTAIYAAYQDELERQSEEDDATTTKEATE